MTTLWEPTAERIARANLTAFAATVATRHGVDVGTYARLWRWSVDHKAEFWREIWNFGEVQGVPGDRVLLDADRMPGARWFPDAKLNFNSSAPRQRAVERATGKPCSGRSQCA